MDMGYRTYDPLIGRFLQVDPLNESFPNITPYCYSYNSPMTWSDPSGLMPTDPFQGTDPIKAALLAIQDAQIAETFQMLAYTKGLNMFKLDFMTSGMLHGGAGGSNGNGRHGDNYTANGTDAASSISKTLGAIGRTAKSLATAITNTAKAIEKTVETVYNGISTVVESIFNVISDIFGTSDNVDPDKIPMIEVFDFRTGKSLIRPAFNWRPDDNGYITYEEAKTWYQYGKGAPLNADLSKINFGNISIENFNYVGKFDAEIYNCNLIINSPNLNDGKVYGNLTLKLIDKNNFGSFDDTYDFDMKEWNNIGNVGRNVETIYANWLHGEGTPFQIKFNGTRAKLPNLNE